METPLLFLATPGSARIGAWRYVPEADRLPFAPGLSAFKVLCGVVTGSSLSVVWAHPSTDPLQYLDGPANPVIDEGVHLYRLLDAVAEQIGNLRPSELGSIAASWLRELDRQGCGQQDLPTLTAALEEVVTLAGRGKHLDKALFVEILFR